jgi:cbb3-type cytochrome oxidase cytochrome c subunit
VLLAALSPLLLSCSSSWGQAQAPRIPDLAQRLGCFACHSLQGRGENLAGRLDEVGARLSPKKLQIALTHPRQLHPGARMPSYAYLPPAEQDALAKYLENLK